MSIAFDSWRECLQFTFARGFWNNQTNNPLVYEKHALENIGGFLTKPILGTADVVGKNIRNPLVIVASTIVLLAAVTIAFYPAQFMFALSFVIPKVIQIKPWMIKFAVYSLVQTAIIGIGIRICGRLSNVHLLDLWNNKLIKPIPIGAKLF